MEPAKKIEPPWRRRSRLFPIGAFDLTFQKKRYPIPVYKRTFKIVAVSKFVESVAHASGAEAKGSGRDISPRDGFCEDRPDIAGAAIIEYRVRSKLASIVRPSKTLRDDASAKNDPMNI